MQVAKQFKDTLRNSGAEVVRARNLVAGIFFVHGFSVDRHLKAHLVLVAGVWSPSLGGTEEGHAARR